MTDTQALRSHGISAITYCTAQKGFSRQNLLWTGVKGPRASSRNMTTIHKSVQKIL